MLLSLEPISPPKIANLQVVSTEKIEDIENFINAKRKKQATYDDAIYRADKFIKYKKFSRIFNQNFLVQKISVNFSTGICKIKLR